MSNPRPPLWLRIAAASGFLVTLLYVVLSIFPIIDVASWWSFAMKISGVVDRVEPGGSCAVLERRAAAIVVA